MRRTGKRLGELETAGQSDPCGEEKKEPGWVKRSQATVPFSGEADGEGGAHVPFEETTALRHWPRRECSSDFRLSVTYVPDSCRHERWVSVELHMRSCAQSHLDTLNGSLVNLVFGR